MLNEIKGNVENILFLNLNKMKIFFKKEEPKKKVKRKSVGEKQIT